MKSIFSYFRMTILVALLLFILIVVGIFITSMPISAKRSDSGIVLVEKSTHGDYFEGRIEDGGGYFSFRYVEVDGHEYLVMSGCHRSGLTHSPKCRFCRRNVKQ